ncbi:MAG: hypothetical protein H0V97_06920, partial [Actinobacteria bacterium]|nr:hypothetical protein [Actinomycetota bacterium]
MQPRKAGDGLFVARQAFATLLNGETVIVQPGQVVDANDPILKGRRELFDDFAPKIRKYPGQRVEQAT